jgi:rod shape-determining protein MreD
MRVAGQVFLAYGLLLVLSAVWRHVPLGRAMPDLVALVAVYLGLTARQRLAPATLGAVIIGYLGDLLIGTPQGLLAVTGGVVCALGHLVHQRLIVRGALMTVLLSLFTGVIGGAVVLLLRRTFGVVGEPLGAELWVLGKAALLTALVGPVVFRLCRLVDARFARTQRERDTALEGLVP